MATDLSACHPGDGIEGLNRLPGLAEPLLQIDLERELQQLRASGFLAAGNWAKFKDTREISGFPNRSDSDEGPHANAPA